MIGFETQDIYIYILYIYIIFTVSYNQTHFQFCVSLCSVPDAGPHPGARTCYVEYYFLNTTKSILNCTCLGFSPRIIVAFVVAPVIGDQYVAISCSGVAIGPMQDQFTQCWSSTIVFWESCSTNNCWWCQFIWFMKPNQYKTHLLLLSSSLGLSTDNCDSFDACLIDFKFCHELCMYWSRHHQCVLPCATN